MTASRAALLAQIADSQEALAMAMLEHRLARLLDSRLTAARLHALAVLDTQGPRAVGALARALGVTAATATGLVDGLVREGYAERAPHPTDGRARIVHATDAGAQAWRDAVLGPTAIDEDVLDQLDDDDLTLLLRAAQVLQRAVTNVTDRRGT